MPLHGRRAMHPSAPVRATLTCPYTSPKGAAVRLVIKRLTEVRKLHAETGDKRVAEYLAMLSVYGLPFFVFDHGQSTRRSSVFV